jgi:hypothetical protein
VLHADFTEQLDFTVAPDLGVPKTQLSHLTFTPFLEGNKKQELSFYNSKSPVRCFELIRLHIEDMENQATA